MKLHSLPATLLLSLCASAAFAQVPATAPAGTTGQCNDGSYSNAASKAGACSGHKGIKTWYVAESKADKKAEVKTDKKAEPMKAAAPASMPATSTPATSTPSAASPVTAPAKAAPAAGAAANKVWVNSDTKVYHCPGTRYYGKTKDGSYMTETEAAAKGVRPDHGKACGK